MKPRSLFLFHHHHFSTTLLLSLLLLLFCITFGTTIATTSAATSPQQQEQEEANEKQNHHNHDHHASKDDEQEEEKPLMVVGLVADNHYDTFPSGEKAPWQPMNAWLQEQTRRTTTTTKRRYDLARDKMLEAVAVFNKHPQLTFAVNLGDLVNNDLMWNLRPILDAFNTVKSARYSIVGNHDRRAHNDRFGKNNRTQELWMMSKLGLTEWFYSVDYPPFMNIFLDSMVMEEPESNPKRRQQLKWLRDTLDKARKLGRVVLLFGHIIIGMATSPFAPLLKEYPHIVGGFFGHHHKGGYLLQGNFHSTIIQGQIETMTNAYAVLEVFADRMELTGFGRVPTRVMKFGNPETVALIKKHLLLTRGKSSSSSLLLPSSTLPAGGGHNQPPAPDSKLWPKDDALLQPVPPLNLNIPSYRKPLIPIAEPNPGDTRFIKKIYSTWPRRVKALAPEPPVDLTSFHKSRRTWYGIRDDGTEIHYHHQQDGGRSSNRNNDNDNDNKQNSAGDHISHHHHRHDHDGGGGGGYDDREQQRFNNGKGSNNNGKGSNSKVRRARRANSKDDDVDTAGGMSSSSSKTTGAGGLDDDHTFFLVEVFLIGSCVLVLVFVAWRYRRRLGCLLSSKAVLTM